MTSSNESPFLPSEVILSPFALQNVTLILKMVIKMLNFNLLLNFSNLIKYLKGLLYL